MEFGIWDLLFDGALSSLTPSRRCDRVLSMLKNIKKQIDKEMDSFLKDARSELDIKSLGGTLYRNVKDFLERDGKRIRPILFIIAYMGFTKKRHINRKKLFRASLSLELLHDFLLIHDDIIDNSDLRRGKPTLHKLFNKDLHMRSNDTLGPNLAIVAGDIIFSMAVDNLFVMDESPAKKEKAIVEFTRSATCTGMGEFLDVLNDTKDIDNITEEDVFLTYTLKTAKYTFSSPMALGAIFAGASFGEIEKLSDLGMVLGQAFQIQDDLLDLFSSSSKIGKPVLSDLNESKKTLPVLKAYSLLNGKDKTLLRNIMRKPDKKYKDLLALRELIKKTCADAYCFKIVKDLLEDANAILESLKMKKRYKNVLKDLVEKTFDNMC